VTHFRDVNCKILKTSVLGPGSGVPGSIHLERRRLRVSCGDGKDLEILELQPENRKPISGGDFANGYRIQPGEKFQPITDN